MSDETDTFTLQLTHVLPAPRSLVVRALTEPDELKKWWGPRGFTTPMIELDLRVGGRYRFEFDNAAAADPVAFFGRYIDVTPHSRLAWTNEESDEGAVTTVTFEERDGRTLLVLHEVYPSKAALDGAIEGMEHGMPEQFEQLDELLVALVTRAGRP